MSRHRGRLLKLIDDMVDVGTPVLAPVLDQAKLPPEAARDLMLAIARGVCERNARTIIYVPGSGVFELTERDRAMWEAYQVDGPDGARKFSGYRVEQLAAEHRLTTQQVYAILRQAKQAELSERQATIPGLDPAE